jgi:hypothetical protein
MRSRQGRESDWGDQESVVRQSNKSFVTTQDLTPLGSLELKADLIPFGTLSRRAIEAKDEQNVSMQDLTLAPS